MHFFVVHNNLTYDFEVYDLMKTNFETLIEILVSSFPGLHEANSKVLNIGHYYTLSVDIVKRLYLT